MLLNGRGHDTPLFQSKALRNLCGQFNYCACPNSRGSNPAGRNVNHRGFIWFRCVVPCATESLLRGIYQGHRLTLFGDLPLRSRCGDLSPFGRDGAHSCAFGCPMMRFRRHQRRLAPHVLLSACVPGVLPEAHAAPRLYFEFGIFRFGR